MIAEYLAFYMALQKRGMATIRSGRTNFAVFSYYKVQYLVKFLF